MLKLDVITVFPELIENAVQFGVLGQALAAEKLSIEAHNPRQHTNDRHRTVDDRPFGGGDGMLMLAEPLALAVQALKHKNSKVVYLSPQGAVFSDKKAKQLSKEQHLILICGRYGGVDQRFLNHFVDEEISIGDYVLSGGELAALVVVDALARFIPGVLGHKDSAEQDSFNEGLLEEPHFTRPRQIFEQEVPEMLLSGDHQAIASWRKKVSALVTLQKRPDLFLNYLEQKRAELSHFNKKKQPQEPLQELHEFWKTLTAEERVSLGLRLTEKDFHV